ncbi:MAG: 50S ribosomal protein L24 [Candidatus Aenigmarchaeota archaeon]|nr:50S ribosomal protein L24 [Candidatus Aenigmarchaeota archaeon]
MKTKNPRKQRKARYNAPLHKRQKLIAAHLSPELRKQYKRRSLGLRKSDEVKIMKGKFKGKTGKIIKISLKKLKVYIDTIKRKKVSGQEVFVPFDASNLMIISPNMDDAKRKKIVTRGK